MAKRRITKRRKLRKRTRRTQRGGSAIVGLLDNADGVPITDPQPVDFIVKFGPTFSKTASDYGNTIVEIEASPEPHVFWKAPPAGTFYTIVCWDPDAEAKSWLHWLVVNCEGMSAEGGQVLQKWSPPSPPKGSGLHRYIFGLFQQGGLLKIDPPEQPRFNMANFAAQNMLTPLAYKGMRVNA